MKAEGKPLGCSPEDFPERREKRIGEMSCWTDGKVHECSLAINIAEQRIDSGWPC